MSDRIVMAALVGFGLGVILFHIIKYLETAP